MGKGEKKMILKLVLQYDLIKNVSLQEETWTTPSHEKKKKKKKKNCLEKEFL
eukprot:CAMPEP_0201477154 /NCGR_PEP_ID=MMETSP0151_2-20130828/2237_1 /ASSEMBLY_ACC=CAM_ASM_000257 /TAXON_ID=200890 /ORGANISM="Paramoeba atlantica, Strain 621/1 / CCAP 1560/9" /LENGTH=51 /DNA_ID=CAMNT_0047857779 /DNA_START=80 /DNA_END=235 /DNA_ORIENTATION=-